MRNKRSSSAKAKHERREVLQEFKHRKLTGTSGELVTDRNAAFGMALAAGGQPGAKLMRLDQHGSRGGKKKPKMGSLRTSGNTG
jgi:hypothetical protein